MSLWCKSNYFGVFSVLNSVFFSNLLLFILLKGEYYLSQTHFPRHFRFQVEEHSTFLAGMHSSSLGQKLSPSISPFAYPLSSIGLNVFDADPSRILSILHHQTMLAEEALRYFKNSPSPKHNFSRRKKRRKTINFIGRKNLFYFSRYRGMLLGPKEGNQTAGTSTASTASSSRMNLSFETLFKEQEQLLKRATAFKNLNRYSMTAQERTPSFDGKESPQIEITHSRSDVFLSKTSPSLSDSAKKTEETVQNLSMSLNDEDLPDDDDELATAAAKIPLDEILGKRGSSYLKESLRFSCNETTSSVSSDIFVLFVLNVSFNE